MRKIVLLMLMAFLSAAVISQEAKIKSVKGKVECSSDGETWYPAEVNKTLKAGDFISTSFKSTAVLVVNDSIINVKPLTRMSIEDLSKSSKGPQTELYLVSGKVQVEVKPSQKGEVTTFTVKSAMATASVRGTGFEFDGENLLVNHGSVKINDTLGITRTVKGGEYGNSGSRGKMPEAVAVKKPAAPLLEKNATAEDIEKAVEKLIETLLTGSPEELSIVAGEFAPETAPGGKPSAEQLLQEIAQSTDQGSVSQVTVTIK